MPKAKLAGMEIEIDEDGFIQEPDKWSKGGRRPGQRGEQRSSHGRGPLEASKLYQGLLHQIWGSSAGADAVQTEQI